ncbi:MAG: Zn-dependent oligopeptidase [Verrucomicrobiae bacterium]|nr:Zn-dependent oligopeptidase [Verrucomicrobiae bacterium]
MVAKLILCVVLVCVLISCAVVSTGPGPGRVTFTDLQRLGARFNSVVALPEFETTPDAVHASVSNTIARANAGLDAIGRLQPHEVSFDNTVRALDDILWEASLTGNRLALIKETSPDPALREAATAAIKVLQEWAVGVEYREDVYRAIKAYADTKPALVGEDAKLLEETMRDYRRAGLGLPKPERDEVERLRKELAKLCTDFDSNITKAQKSLKFTRAELEGVPESFLNQPGIKTGEDEYTIQVNVTWQYLAVMENAKREDVRRRVFIAQHTLAKEENVPLLERILALRSMIARKLGYASWADYQIEVKMAKTAARAIEFEQKLVAGLQPKFEAELEEFRKLKAAETGDPNAKIEAWDWRYYAERLKRAKYNVDAEQLRIYFPLQQTLDGMFRVYERIFGVRFEQIEPPYKWADEVQLWSVTDAETGEPLGLFYLDMYPRPGKYNHFAMFELIGGKLLPDGRYQRPVVAMVCNFPPPQPDKPSLLKHGDVETLFHEFGHVMHNVLTRAKFARFAGSNVPRDFVEAPSQMLENWVWDKEVLDSFAADYRDPKRKIPTEILDQLKAARLAVEGTRYRRQLAFGLMDLTLHTQITETNAADAVALANKVLGEVFLPVPPDTAFVAYFGHLTGYDAGYYSYAWADAISSDMATVFEQAPNRYFDAEAGRKLRKEIYEVGDSRDVNISIERFLGRAPSIEPFLKKIGAQPVQARPTSQAAAQN